MPASKAHLVQYQGPRHEHACDRRRRQSSRSRQSSCRCRTLPATSTAGHQFWIWAGANIAPINWVLGSLGIEIGLSLSETVLVLVIGNVIGMVTFGFFVLMGQRTGVSQMVMARSAFGRRGAYLPAAIQGLISAGWCAVNTWIVLDLVLALIGKLGYHGGTGLKIVIVVVCHGPADLAGGERLQVDREVRALHRPDHLLRPCRDDDRRLVEEQRPLGLCGRPPARLGAAVGREHDHDGDRDRLGMHLVRLRVGLLPLRAEVDVAVARSSSPAFSGSSSRWYG